MISIPVHLREVQQVMTDYKRRTFATFEVGITPGNGLVDRLGEDWYLVKTDPTIISTANLADVSTAKLINEIVKRARP